MRVDERDRAVALANRSRRRVFDEVKEAAQPIGVVELAKACGIHPNTVRLHLDRLVRAGLVARAPDTSQRPPGRPPHRYVIADDTAIDGVDAIALAMAVQGFRPTVDRTGPSPRVVLQACPFADIAVKDQATICRLHLGMAEGLAAAVGDVAVERLVVNDPDEAGCSLVLRLR